MAKKTTPAWQLMGLDGPPPVVNGYHDYGRVWHVGMPRQTRWEGLCSDVRWGLWSWHYWGKKVRTGIAAARADGERHWAHGLVLVLVWLTDAAYRRLVRP